MGDPRNPKRDDEPWNQFLAQGLSPIGRAELVTR
jgi:hypothetical protein